MTIIWLASLYDFAKPHSWNLVPPKVWFNNLVFWKWLHRTPIFVDALSHTIAHKPQEASFSLIGSIWVLSSRFALFVLWSRASFRNSLAICTASGRSVRLYIPIPNAESDKQYDL